MNITSLFIEDYKLLNEFSISFQKDVSILIGINGSGKSTILESIAQIFSDAFLREKSKFGFKLLYELRLEEILEQTATTSDFKTEYIKVEISASKKNERFTFKVYVDGKVLENENEIEKHFGYFDKILPSNIVIYYSGLAEIMKRICLPHDQKLSVNYRKANTNINRPFFYFEPPLFNFILITLLSYEFGDIPEFLRDNAKIKGVNSIQLILKKPSWAKGNVKNWWGAKGEVKVLLDLLNDIANPSDIEKNELLNKSNGNVIIESFDNENLIITILGQEKLFEVREYFVEEKTLFKILNTLIIDGFAPEVKFLLIQTEGNNSKSFDVLSEGEQQAIIVRGLVELVDNENTLFLFDEPDTYLHPSWQRSFIESINQLANRSEFNTSQFLITTHSPQLLSNANSDNCEVHIMEDGKIIKITPKYYGKDINTILYEMMGVEKRNKKFTKLLSSLFNNIEDEELELSKKEYEDLVKDLGENDPAIVRAKVQLDYLVESKGEKDK
ncbi:MAG: AAA family ATPase [Janthinobacterium lividum]